MPHIPSITQSDSDEEPQLVSSPYPSEPNSISVIIPCFNAEKWVAQAIESCLNQTVGNVEIIVVDDGSTDGSRKVLEGYSDRIQTIYQVNLGACVARNVGYLRSHGEFVQFLDADDYLLPQKLELQRDCLASTAADVVYGDWRHQVDTIDGRQWMEPEVVSGKQDDVLFSLIRGWWISPAALLWRRSIIDEIGGWDNSLPGAQDRDFFTRVALKTQKIVYQPGCHSIYRRHGNETISTSKPERLFRALLRVVEKTHQLLQAGNRLTAGYRYALSHAYFYCARNLFKYDAKLAADLLKLCYELNPEFKPEETTGYNLLFNTLGFDRAERLAGLKRNVAKLVNAVMSPRTESRLQETA